MPWKAASKPVVHTLDLKPSQEIYTIGIPISFSALSAMDSISSPIMPEAQEVVINIAFGLNS